MQFSRFQKFTLGLSGIIALGIGSFITFAPHAFYAGYGITLGPDPNLLSELRAPGAGLAVLGMIMLAGIVLQGLARVAFIVALTVFLAFPAGRIIGLVIDGLPSGSVIGALAIEVVIAALLLAAFRPRQLKQSGLKTISDAAG